MPCLLRWLAVAVVLTGLVAWSPAAADDPPPSADAGSTVPEPPPLPAFQKITILPGELALVGPRAAGHFLVQGHTADGTVVDVTEQAAVQVRGDAAEFAPPHVLRPVRDGEATLAVTLGELAAEAPVRVTGLEPDPPISFVRDVMPILTKSGCNAGTCHGAAKGKNGFRLSLRGYDPEFDYLALVQDISGRRFNRADPSQSLMVQKPTGGVPHQGGFLFPPDAPAARVLEQWIAQGAASDVETIARAARLEVQPTTVTLDLPGRTQRFLTIAHYPDGTLRDVTAEVQFTSSAPEVATVSEDGRATALRRGETALIVRYEGLLGTVGMTVMGARDGFVWEARPQHNFIDQHIDAKLQRLKIQPSELCSDAEFVRRLHLDLTGRIPEAEVVQAFLADPTPSKAKRDQLIERLLASEDFVDHWTHKWCDLLQVNRKFLGDTGMWAFHGWIRQAVARDMPYDQFVRELLTGVGDPDERESGSANFLRINHDPKQAAENTTQLFLGVRFSCCQCHDHPFEQWTQRQYYGLTAYFAQAAFGQGGRTLVFDRRSGETLHPKTQKPVAPFTPYSVQKGAATPPVAAATRREQLADWLTAPENPIFARAMVNRTWSLFFHRGIIDPVDDIRSSNPPINPELLDALAADFASHGYQVRHLVRTIVQSRTYQHSFRANRWNADDEQNFSRALPRRLSAEQLLDSLMVATGSRTSFPGLPRGLRAAQLPDAQFPSQGFLEQFGKPARESSCECERSSDVSLGQALLMINGPTVATALADPQGRLAKLLAANLPDADLVEALYLAAWCRPPTASERQRALAALQGDLPRAQVAQDLLWALINSPGFLFNY
ncbi:MAG TPA: DUF1553 domain-containing protein [Gemmatales bacterium]|nr:DUF1553 domain-containing protein [Gemmatales bacterium]